MKTLAQIEPRTPIPSLPFTISAPGSYYLTTNLTAIVSNAIMIAAGGVTLDLGGFTISSTVANAAAGGTAILLDSGVSDIAIFNGHIRSGVTYSGGSYSGGGFGYGIYSATGPASNVRISGVSVVGCLYDAINVGNGAEAIVESCTVNTAGGYGIVAANAARSAAVQCGGYAIYATTASDCTGYATGTGEGVYAVAAHNCVGYSDSGQGVYATEASNCQGNGGLAGVAATVANNCFGNVPTGNGTGVFAENATSCYGSSDSGTGVSAEYTAVGCSGFSTSGTGLSARNASTCNGYSFGSGTGLDVSDIATGCRGSSGSGTGLHSLTLAIGCSGSSGSAGGTGLSTYIAEACRGVNSVNYSVSANFKYNMP